MLALLNRVRSLGALAVAFAVAVLCGSPLWATAPTLPPTGVDIPSYLTVAITALGVIVVAAIAGWFAFQIIRVGIRWVRHMF